METSIDRVAKLLIERKLTIAFAESATAGALAYGFSRSRDAGEYLKGGLVCYDARLKQEILGVDAQLIQEFTPESMEVTEAITRGLARLISADIHVGVTGLPAPGGSETEEKPVGTMFIFGILNGTELVSHRQVYAGSAEAIIRQTVDCVGELVYKTLIDTNNRQPSLP